MQEIIVKRLEGYQGYNDIKNYFNVDGESRWGGAVSGDMKTFFEKDSKNG